MSPSLGKARKVLCVMLVAAALLSASPLENVRTDSWVYEAVDFLHLSGWIRAVPSSSRPWTRNYASALVREALFHADFTQPSGIAAQCLRRLTGEFAVELQDLGRHQNAGAYTRWRPFFNIPVTDSGIIGLDFFSRIRGDTANQSGSLGAVFNTSGTERLALYSRMEFSGFRKQISDVLDSAWIIRVPGTREHSLKQRFLFDVPEAYLRFGIPWFELELGRDFLYWGPGYRSSVMLSNAAPSLDQVQLTATFRRLKLTSFTAALSPWRNDHRYLSGQRLEVNFWDRLVLGGAMFAGYSLDSAQTKTPAGYLNPLIPIYFELANSGHDDNLLVGADATLYLPRVKLYAQLLLDNYEFVDSLPWETELRPPDAYGAQLGLLVMPFNWASIRAEYARITRYTYYHRLFQTAYTQYDVPLGHTLGPDADELFGQIQFWPAELMTFGVVATLTRRGDKNRGDEYSKSWVPSNTYRSRAFPSGVVERTLAFGPQVSFSPASWFSARATVNWLMTSNLGGDTTQTVKGAGFNASIEFRY